MKDLLSKARRDYPSGCIIKSARDGCIYKTKGDIIFQDGSIYCNVYLYYKKKWAKIISYPEGYQKFINVDIIYHSMRLNY